MPNLDPDRAWNSLFVLVGFLNELVHTMPEVNRTRIAMLLDCVAATYLSKTTIHTLAFSPSWHACHWIHWSYLLGDLFWRMDFFICVIHAALQVRFDVYLILKFHRKIQFNKFGVRGGRSRGPLRASKDLRIRSTTFFLYIMRGVVGLHFADSIR